MRKITSLEVENELATSKRSKMNIVLRVSILSLSLTAFEARAEPLEFPSSQPPCEPKSNSTVIDISMPVPDLFVKKGNWSVLKALRDDFKVDTVFRYYDDTDHPSIPGKPMRALESDALLAAGFKIGIVFQHNNDSAAKFHKPGVGKADASLALNLADENLQPFNSAIYFGIDGPFQPKDLEENKRNVRQYFQDIEAVFGGYAKRHGGNGYDIGIYCSADMCSVGDDLKLKYTWLSPAGRDLAEYKKRFKNRDRLNLVQSQETKCGDKWGGAPKGQEEGFDFDQINSDNPNLGTWDHKR